MVQLARHVAFHGSRVYWPWLEETVGPGLDPARRVPTSMPPRKQISHPSMEAGGMS